MPQVPGRRHAARYAEGAKVTAIVATAMTDAERDALDRIAERKNISRALLVRMILNAYVRMTDTNEEAA